MATVSMVMIARDEKANIEPCFSSFWDHVDDIVLCDTGSRDGTIAAARRFAKDRGEPGKLTIGKFKWCDDFAAARAHAHSLARGDVHCRIDLDDRLQGGHNLRSVALNFDSDPDLVTIMALWSGPITPVQWRGQIFRGTGHVWSGKTYEYPHFLAGRAGATDLVRWHHTRSTPRGRRDLDIALQWAKDDPADWRAMNAAAEEAFILGEHWLAAECCATALELDVGEHTRAYFLGLHARALCALGKHSQARTIARRALKVAGGLDPSQTDFLGVAHKAWMTLIRCEFKLRDEEILRCARSAMDIATTEEGRQEVIALVAQHQTAGDRRLGNRVRSPSQASLSVSGSPTSSQHVRWVQARGEQR